MKIVLFYHSILSCWNHGNVHFLRGVARELIRLGHEVVVYEPEDGWSRQNALLDGGATELAEAASLVPGVVIHSYDHKRLDLDAATADSDLVIVHEWNAPELIAAIGRRRAAGAPFTLLFHDTHHRSVTAQREIEGLDLDGYDAVLAFGEVLRELYVRAGWGRQALTWHEAADTALFHPLPAQKDVDVIWIGNWGDNERSREIETYLVNPVARLGISGRIHGVRYPEAARTMLAQRGIAFGGWLPNRLAPQAYAKARATVHIPRAPYVDALPGIPTIRVFEALACGIPLICSPWWDDEGLFPPGAYLIASDEKEMTAALRHVLSDAALAQHLTETGLRAIAERHTCAHRVQQLLGLVRKLKARPVTTPDERESQTWVAPI
jgi:spore maturation protein CgeB